MGMAASQCLCPSAGRMTHLGSDVHVRVDLALWGNTSVLVARSSAVVPIVAVFTPGRDPPERPERGILT